VEARIEAEDKKARVDHKLYLERERKFWAGKSWQEAGVGNPLEWCASYVRKKFCGPTLLVLRRASRVSGREQCSWYKLHSTFGNHISIDLAGAE